MIKFLFIIFLISPSLVSADMFARYDITTRQLKHWSIVPFTSQVPVGQADKSFSNSVNIPGPIRQLRLTSDLSGLEIDPVLVPPPPVDHTQALINAINAANTLQQLKDALTGRNGNSSVGGRLK